jgi:hypothetical protein
MSFSAGSVGSAATRQRLDRRRTAPAVAVRGGENFVVRALVPRDTSSPTVIHTYTRPPGLVLFVCRAHGAAWQVLRHIEFEVLGIHIFPSWDCAGHLPPFSGLVLETRGSSRHVIPRSVERVGEVDLLSGSVSGFRLPRKSRTPCEPWQ